MFKELHTKTKKLIDTRPELFTGGDGIKRGKIGSTNVAKSPGIIMHYDFGDPEPLDDAQNNKKPVIELFAYCYSGSGKDILEAEDSALDFAENIIELITSEQITVFRRDGSPEVQRWEFTTIEWMERKQSGCVIACGFKMPLWW